jgi:hypothetical protein
MTELLEGAAEVRTNAQGLPVALRTRTGWRRVIELALTWRVETDWWRLPIGRDYMRCLLADGECVDVYRDLYDGTWHWTRRYD